MWRCFGIFWLLEFKLGATNFLVNHFNITGTIETNRNHRNYKWSMFHKVHVEWKPPCDKIWEYSIEVKRGVDGWDSGEFIHFQSGFNHIVHDGAIPGSKQEAKRPECRSTTCSLQPSRLRMLQPGRARIFTTLLHRNEPFTFRLNMSRVVQPLSFSSSKARGAGYDASATNRWWAGGWGYTCSRWLWRNA